MIETKQIDDLLKDDAYYFRKRLEVSKNVSSYDCPDCNEKMRRNDMDGLGGFLVNWFSMWSFKSSTEPSNEVSSSSVASITKPELVLATICRRDGDSPCYAQ